VALCDGTDDVWAAVCKTRAQVDEETKLKKAIETHGDKNQGAISALVPGRTNKQCNNRWHTVLDSSIAVTTGRMGKWEEDEDMKLKDAMQTQGDKDWAALSALVPGRTSNQCWHRWTDLGSQLRSSEWTQGEMDSSRRQQAR
jgi:hypothetical protein